MKPTLVILAAGMGSRYGGLKQLDQFGPNKETIIDYSLYDAIQAGFGKIVFVIRESFRKEMTRVFGEKLEGKVGYTFVSQELDQLPKGFKINPKRKKPWGTAHAVQAAKYEVDGPFGVINADDYYGREAFFTLSRFFNSNPDENTYSIVAYSLSNTLSEHGTVNRGICKADTEGYLTTIEEIVQIETDKSGHITYPGSNGKRHLLQPDEIVSMNFFGFYPTYFDYFNTYFRKFLDENGNQLNSEYYIPTFLDELIKERKIKVKILHSTSEWFGVTYKKDKTFVKTKIAELISKQMYPEKLWG